MATAEPLPYVPLINPLELGLLFALFGVYVWSRSAVTQLAIRKDYAAHATQLIAGVSLFAFFTALVMRTAHHWGGVPFELDALLDSMRVQAGLVHRLDPDGPEPDDRRSSAPSPRGLADRCGADRRAWWPSCSLSN